MANAKQVLDVQVSKGITAAQGNEHLRNRSKEAEKYAMSKGNYDPTRKHLNFEIVPGGKVRPIDTSRNIPERIADILDRRGIKDPNEGLIEPKYRTVVNIIFGGSRERMHELAFGTQKVDFEKGADNTRIKRKSDIERWAKDVYSFVCGRYGEQNVAAFIVHLDELNPHVHCTLLPIKDGKFAYKEIFAGKDKFEYSARMKQLHTDFFRRGQHEVGNGERPERRRDRRTAQDDGGIPPYALGRVHLYRTTDWPASGSPVRPPFGHPAGRAQGQGPDVDGGKPEKGAGREGGSTVGT